MEETPSFELFSRWFGADGLVRWDSEREERARERTRETREFWARVPYLAASPATAAGQSSSTKTPWKRLTEGLEPYSETNC